VKVSVELIVIESMQTLLSLSCDTQHQSEDDKARR
jgi:hypothetical protein